MKAANASVGALLKCLAVLGIFALSSHSRAADGMAIFVMRPDGSEVREVARVPKYLEHSAPRFSHDGKRLVFAVARDAETDLLSRKFFIVNVDGTGLKAIDVDMMPNWSPDDSQFAYHRNPGDGGASTVYVRDIYGLERKRVIEGKSPRWRPNGGVLAIRDEKMLRALNLVSNEMTDLFPAPVEQIRSGYTWSPDGKRIAR